MFLVIAHYEADDDGQARQDRWRVAVADAVGRRPDAEVYAYNRLGLLWRFEKFDLAIAMRRKLLKNGIYATAREQ